MVDAGIGRLLIASLHQGIADILPARLPFYENWLTPPGLRDAKFGLAPLHAVLSFCRLEGPQTYEQVMSRAGAYTADWAYSDLSSMQRAVVRGLPMVLRARWALFLCKRLVAQTFRGSRATTRLRRGTGTFDIRASIFCGVRDRTAFPMCVFYRAAVERFLQRFDIDAVVNVSQCKASGGNGCTMAVSIRGERAEETAAEAA
jgi:bacteriochlorophyll 4-vinyl reductase